MKTIAPFLAVAGGALVGLSAGFALRGLSTGAHNAGANAVASESNASPGKAASQGRVRADGLAATYQSPLTAQLAGDLSMSSGVTNWLYWWAAIEKATPVDIPALLRLARGNPVATQLVAEYWADKAPEQLFQALVAAAKTGNGFPHSVSQLLLNAWLKRDPDAVVSALNGKEDFPQRAGWRMQVAAKLTETDPERGLSLLSEWHIENFLPRMDGIRRWADSDPRHAAEVAIASPAGYASQQALAVIGREWAKTAPAEALSFALQQRTDLGQPMADAILQSWTSQDLNAAGAWLAAASPDVQSKFVPSFVRAWAKQDPSGALTWCQSNLQGSTLAQAVGGLFKGAAEKDVAGAAAMVSAMAPSPARSQAAVAVAGKWFPESFPGSKPVPAAALTWLSKLDPGSVRKVLGQVAWQWEATDPKGMASFLESAGSGEVPGYVDSSLARTMARTDPSGTLAWAAKLPSDQSLVAGSTAFAEWGRTQPGYAMQWWNQLPANDTRRQPFLRSLLEQLAWDPRANAQFAQVAAVDPEAAREALAGSGGLDAQRRATLLDLIPHR